LPLGDLPFGTGNGEAIRRTKPFSPGAGKKTAPALRLALETAENADRLGL